MDEVRFLDTALLDAVSAQAQAGKRRRKNHNFHPADDFPCHRLLNAIEPDSYVPPHRHLDPDKAETIIAVRGRLGLVVFDAEGNVLQTRELAPGGECCGCDLPAGTIHTVLALEPGTVCFEAKAGPYRPLTLLERPAWAPAEDAPEARRYLHRLRRYFD
jgi:cupin fold WbuC family metalloprotein